VVSHARGGSCFYRKTPCADGQVEQGTPRRGGI
jgi:hypothetical protein